MPIEIEIKIQGSNLLILTFLEFVQQFLDPLYLPIKFLQPKHL